MSSKKCPFCAEEILEEAIKCKHCGSDILKTQSTNVRPMDKKNVKTKKEIEREKLSKMTGNEKNEYYIEKKRQRNIKIIWWGAGLLCIFTIMVSPEKPNNIFSRPFIQQSPLIIGYIFFFIALWLHPKKNEKIFINRFSNIKNYKSRIIISSVFLLFFIFAFNASYNAAKLKEVKTNYPQPSIEILSSKERQGNAKEYHLVVSAKNTDKVLVNDKEILGNDDKYTATIILDTPNTRIKITAKNEYKQTDTSLAINRDKNAQEIALDKEEQKKAEEAARYIEEVGKEWEQSKAGIICKKHPSWSAMDCSSVGEGRVWIGMTYDMLVASYGSKPNHVNPSNYGTGTRWQWCWSNMTPSCFYDDNGDKIIDSYN